MKKFVLTFYFLVISFVLYAFETVYVVQVVSDNTSVTGAVLAELMEVLQTENVSVVYFDFYKGRFDGKENRSLIMLNFNRYISTDDAYNLLKARQYWINNLKMTLVDNGSFSKNIHVIYPFNGKNYPVEISFTVAER